MITLTPSTDLTSLIGTPLGVGGWLTVDQELIDGFAAVTGDHQWLHTDPERARSGPYGATIAHGFLVLSLLPQLAADAVELSGFASVVNYGLDRVRFPAPVRAGSRIRDALSLDSVEETARGTLLRMTHTIEVEGQDRPGCVAQQLRLLTTGT
jgi:acyl dehydratase